MRGHGTDLTGGVDPVRPVKLILNISYHNLSLLVFVILTISLPTCLSSQMLGIQRTLWLTRNTETEIDRGERRAGVNILGFLKCAKFSSGNVLNFPQKFAEMC